MKQTYIVTIKGNDTFIQEYGVRADNIVEAAQESEKVCEQFQKTTIEKLEVIKVKKAGSGADTLPHLGKIPVRKIPA